MSTFTLELDDDGWIETVKRPRIGDRVRPPLRRIATPRASDTPTLVRLRAKQLVDLYAQVLSAARDVLSRERDGGGFADPRFQPVLGAGHTGQVAILRNFHEDELDSYAMVPARPLGTLGDIAVYVFLHQSARAIRDATTEDDLRLTLLLRHAPVRPMTSPEWPAGFTPWFTIRAGDIFDPGPGLWDTLSFKTASVLMDIFSGPPRYHSFIGRSTTPQFRRYVKN